MVAEKRCPTVLLDDSPASSDAFGSHQRVADAVTEVVRIETGGRSIGLEGGWGSGKSTVVQLVAQKLSKIRYPEFQVATFDMWAHQGDPLRRTFLEKLIKQLRNCEWVNDGNWKVKQQELAGRRREDATSVVPRLTVAGGWFALTLLVIPVGAALISAALALWAAEDPPSGWVIAGLLGVGAVLAFLPGLYYGGWRWRQKRKGDDGFNDLPALVMGQASTETRTIVTETPDPTSVEFETIFGDLLSDALEGKNRKLLLVVDNLDRVQPSDALSIWSTLQTFLGHSDYRDVDWIDQLWILIPYDKGAILQLWDGSREGVDETEKSLLATSFLDKTFQIRFRVPQLLLSKWREFLRAELNRALPKHNDDDFHGVYRAFAARGGLETSAPTPRDLKILVNQIGALHRKWEDTFNLTDYACYSMLQKDNEDVHRKLLANENPGFLARIIGPEWREIIAALHFGVPVDEANQLLLRGPIETALMEGNGEKLSELASIHPVGFWSVLEHAGPFGAEGWGELRGSDLARCASALSNCRVFVDATDAQEAISVKSGIHDSVLASNDWEPFDATTVSGVVAVAKLVGESEEIIPKLLSCATNTSAANGVLPRVWMSSALTLLDGLAHLGYGDRLDDGIVVPLSGLMWFDVSQEVAKRDPEGKLLQHLELEFVDEINESLVATFAARQLDPQIFSAAQTALATRSRNSLAGTAEAALEDFTSGVYWSGDEHAMLLKLLRLSNSAGLFRDNQLSDAGAASHYLNHLHSAFSEGRPEAVAEALFGFFQMVPNAQEPDSVESSSSRFQNVIQILDDPEVVSGSVDHFTGLIEGTGQLPILFEAAEAHWPNVRFLERVLINLTDSTSVEISHRDVGTYWHIVKNALEHYGSQSFPTFLKELPKLHELVERLISESFDVDECGLYLNLVRCDVGEEFLTWCVDGVKRVEKDSWDDEIDKRGYLVDLAIELNNSTSVLSLGVGFSDDLIEWTELVAKRNDESLSEEYWCQLLDLLTSDQRKMFARRVYKILVETNGEASARFFNVFGPLIATRDVLGNEIRFVDDVFTPIVNADNATGIRWIAGIVESDPLLLIEHDDTPARVDFADRVRQKISNTGGDDPKFEDLVKIRNALPAEVSSNATTVENETDADGVLSA